MPAIESISLGYKIADLAWEMGKAFRSSIDIRSNGGAPHRITSSLTTLEFVQDGSKQVAYFVQDRTVAFRKPDTRLPPFLYATAGTDSIDQLVVDDANKAFTCKTTEFMRLVGPADDIVYNKGDHARAVLFAHSVDGFTKDSEDLSTAIRQPTDSSTMVIVFPPERKPKSVGLLYRENHDPLDSWRPAHREKNKYELRLTTRGRSAFYWEEKNLRLGRTYKIQWDW